MGRVNRRRGKEKKRSESSNTTSLYAGMESIEIHNSRAVAADTEIQNSLCSPFVNEVY